jgi:hypothetical protein
MKFSVFLTDLCQQKNCNAPHELYENLGGEKRLGVALRTFRAIASGQIPPSLKFFSSLFSLLPEHMRKDALISFFESSSPEDSHKTYICSYLEERLSVEIDSDVDSLWSKREPQFFSENQLRYLSRSNDVVRVYNRLVCHSPIGLSECRSSTDVEILKDLVNLGIASTDGKVFTRTKELFRLPHQDNSPGELVGPASDFILQHVEAFMAREGVPGEQELGYSFHTCKKKDAIRILEQMRNFKKWVQSFGLTEDHPDEVSFVWVDFGRILRRNRDY